MKTTLTFSLMVLILLSGCESKQDQSFPITETDREAIRAGHVARGKAVVDGDVDAAVAVATEDVVMMPPGSPPVSGRKNMEEHFRNWIRNNPAKSFTFQPEEIVGTGNLAYDRGTYRLENADTVITGQYLWIWRKDPEKGWRHSVAMWRHN